MTNNTRNAGQPSSAQYQGSLINHEAERAVIAALMRKPDGKEIIRLAITPDLFDSPPTREAFTAIVSFIADGIQPDAATLRSALSGAALIEVETSLQEHVSAANLPVYVNLLKACKREREINAARQRLAQANASGAPEHELRAILDSIQQTRTEASGPPRFQWAEDFCQNTALADDLIDGYIPARTVGLLFGDSQAYKSFLLIDIAGHIATGQPWRGRDVQPGKVLFIAGEGGNGLKARIKAWFDYHRQPMRHFAVSIVPLELCDPSNAEQLISEIRQFISSEHSGSIALIVLDTLNTHFGPGDENATADMTRFRLACIRLSQATGATVVISHHCGHQDKERGRGSRSLYQGVDWEFKLERSGDYTTLMHTKVKDGPKQPPLCWQLIQQPLPWADRNGRPINGALLIPADPPAMTSKATTLTSKPREALELLADLYQQQRQNLKDAGHDPDQARVSVADWQEAMKPISADSSNRAKLRKWLAEQGFIRIEGPFVYPVYSPGG